MIKKYREQVLSVDACQFDGANQQELITWGEGKISGSPGGGLQLEMQPGTFAPINTTDWVTHDVYKNWWVVKDSNFQVAYAPGPSQR